MPAFLCFDLELRFPADADLVEAASPAHACQEFAANSFRMSGGEERPYHVGVRYEEGDPNVWDAYRVIPEVSVTYGVAHLTAAEFAAVPKATPPVYHAGRPQLKPIPGANGDMQVVPFDPRNRGIGLNDDGDGMMGDPSLYKG